jgi:transcriptional regulator with XRE-family HTH domain
VPGLRRTEVASLAGMSVEYYFRLERGNLAGVSEEVIEALSRALELETRRSELTSTISPELPPSEQQPLGRGPSPSQFARPFNRLSMPSPQRLP